MAEPPVIIREKRPGPIRLLEGAKKIISNPVVQGAGLTALAGFNPLVGLLAAPHIKAGMDESRLDRERSSAELNLLRDRITQTASMRSGLDELVTSLGSPQRAQSGEVGAPGTAGFGQSMQPRISAEQARYLRSLVQGAPHAAVPLIGGLLGMGEKRPARGLEGTFESIENRIGRPLTEDEVFSLADRGSSGMAAQLGLNQSMLEIMRAQIELKAREDELSEEHDDRERESLLKKQDFLAQVGRDLEAAEIIDEIESKLLTRPGFAADARAQVQSAIGLVDPDSGELAAKQQRFKQLSTLSGLDVVKAYGLNPTDTKFKRMMETALSPNNAPDVNRLVLLERLELASQNTELPLEVRDEIRMRIKQIKSRNGSKRRFFMSEDDIEAALESGEIKFGDEIIFNGRRVRIDNDG